MHPPKVIPSGDCAAQAPAAVPPRRPSVVVSGQQASPQAAAPAAPEGTGVRATVIAPGAARGGELGAQPSVVPGVIRKGLVVAAADLARQFPGVPEPVIARAVQVLQGTVLDSLSPARCATWGVQAQQAYGAWVDASLRITQASVLQDAQRHLARLQVLLHTLAESLLAPASPSIAFWRKDPKPWDVLMAQQAELKQLRRHMSAALPALRALQADMRTQAAEWLQLAQQLQADSLAAQYLSDLLLSELLVDAQAKQAPDGADNRPHVLMQQSLALAQTAVQIQASLPVRDAQQHSLDGLVHQVQTTVLLALPAWLEKAALAQQSAQLSETERYTLGQELQAVLNTLRPPVS